MRAAVLIAPGRIEVQDRPDPVPRPQEVVADVLAAGVCGTDLALFRGDFPFDGEIIPGHEFAAVVTETGPGVPESWLGARVTCEINITCVSTREQDACPACRRDLSSHCFRRRVLGLRGADGAFAEKIRLPVNGMHRLPDALAPDVAVFVEPLAAALRTFVLTPLQPGATVAVLGAGRLGLLVCRVARSHGARVLAFETDPGRRERSLRFGAQAAFDPEDSAGRAALEEATDGLGADVVVEATGRPDGFGRALGLVRPRGTVCLKTTCGREPEGLSATDLVVREITVQGSRCGPFPEAIERLASGQIPVHELLTDRFSLEQVADAYAAAGAGRKVLLVPTASGPIAD